MSAERDRLEKRADQMGIRELAAIVARLQDERADLLRRLTEALRQLTECRERLAALEVSEP